MRYINLHLLTYLLTYLLLYNVDRRTGMDAATEELLLFSIHSQQ